VGQLDGGEACGGERTVSGGGVVERVGRPPVRAREGEVRHAWGSGVEVAGEDLGERRGERHLTPPRARLRVGEPQTELWRDLPRFHPRGDVDPADRKSTRLNSSHVKSSYAVFRLKKKTPGS